MTFRLPNEISFRNEDLLRTVEILETTFFVDLKGIIPVKFMNRNDDSSETEAEQLSTPQRHGLSRSPTRRARISIYVVVQFLRLRVHLAFRVFDMR